MRSLTSLVLASGTDGGRRGTNERSRDSRVLGTRTLARAIASLEPPPSVLVSGSAIGYYGDTGDEPVDESSPNGSGFLAQVVVAWEGATATAKDAGVRVVHPRSGLVVARHGGAWGRMWPVFKLGVGGRFGNGRQYWSFVSLRDEVRALRRMLEDASMSGLTTSRRPSRPRMLRSPKPWARCCTDRRLPAFRRSRCEPPWVRCPKKYSGARGWCRSGCKQRGLRLRTRPSPMPAELLLVKSHRSIPRST